MTEEKLRVEVTITDSELGETVSQTIRVLPREGRDKLAAFEEYIEQAGKDALDEMNGVYDD